jgi:serine/threonine-protein phosphatase PGAM5
MASLADPVRPPVRRLILVRHGDSVRGPEEALTDAGHEQVRLTAQRLSALPPIDRIVHTPMPRAAQTAALLAAALHIDEVSTDNRLAECTPSVPAQHLLTENQQAIFAGFGADYLDAGAIQAAAAAEHFLTPPQADDADQVDLLVSHANLIRWLITTAIGAGKDSWFQLGYYHCALSTIVLRPDRQPAALTVNDSNHLTSALRGDDHPPELRW